MQYVVCLSTRHVTPVHHDKRAPTIRVHITTQYIRCGNINEAQSVAAAISMRHTDNLVGVMVWNGKGNTFVPCDTIAQVYDDMTMNKPNLDWLPTNGESKEA